MIAKEDGVAWRNVQRQTNPNSAQTEGREWEGHERTKYEVRKGDGVRNTDVAIRAGSASDRPRLTDHESRITARAEAQWPNKANSPQAQRGKRERPGLRSMIDNGNQRSGEARSRLDGWRLWPYRRSAAVLYGRWRGSVSRWRAGGLALVERGRCCDTSFHVKVTE